MSPRKLVTTLLLLAVVALLFLAAVWRWQDRLLYFPDRAPAEQLASGGLRAWPSAQDFKGLVAGPSGAARGTVVVFHGNAGHAGHRAFYAQALVPQGWRVLLAEHPGYVRAAARWAKPAWWPMPGRRWRWRTRPGRGRCW